MSRPEPHAAVKVTGWIKPEQTAGGGDRVHLDPEAFQAAAAAFMQASPVLTERHQMEAVGKVTLMDPTQLPPLMYVEALVQDPAVIERLGEQVHDLALAFTIHAEAVERGTRQALTPRVIMALTIAHVTLVPRPAGVAVTVPAGCPHPNPGPPYTPCPLCHRDWWKDTERADHELQARAYEAELFRLRGMVAKIIVDPTLPDGTIKLVTATQVLTVINVGTEPDAQL